MTPIQQAIADIEIKIKEAREELEYSEPNEAKQLRLYSYINAYTLAIATIESQLQYERHTIEQAFRAGANEAEFGNTLGSAYENSSDYFTKQFDTK